MTIKIQIASLPDRENVVAELWVGNVQVAEVSKEDGPLRVELYSPPGANHLDLPLDEFLDALQRAKENLAG